MNKISKTIGWADYSWNPVTGCQRGCVYCYARKIHERFYKTPFTDIVFHKERMNEIDKIKKPSKIFVGSMSDIEYWDKTVLRAVASKCEFAPQHTFMFLSKSPASYIGYNWPVNTMQGLTMTCSQDERVQFDLIMRIMRFKRPWLSIEPINGELKTRITSSTGIERVIVGAMTGRGATTPKPEWIESIKRNVATGEIYWKKNILKYMGN